MKSHFAVNGGVAVACAVAGASTLLSGNCSGDTFIAADYATNSTYAGGWSAGQNGGYGWGAWSMDGTGTNLLQNTMDHTSPFDPFGVAWTLYNPEGTVPGGTSPGTHCVNPPTSTDISRAGRAFPYGALQPGQTFTTVIANPTSRTFFRGYTIVLSNGADNIAYGGAGTSVAVGAFEYFSYGRWYTSPTFNTGGTTLFDTDTSTNGMQLDFTLTSTNSYHLVMTPLGNPAIAYAEDGTFTNTPITWVTYQLFNTDSDFYPTLAPCGPDRTDFYIKSMTVQGLTLNIQRAGPDIILTWPTNASGFNLESTTNLGVGVLWTPVTPLPTVVNGQNAVTNPLGSTRQFYRLKQ
jgi:hypothetical protein